MDIETPEESEQMEADMDVEEPEVSKKPTKSNKIMESTAEESVEDMEQDEQ